MRYAIFIMTLAICAHTALAATDLTAVFQKPGEFVSTGGEEIYRENCAGCHMANGAGVKTGAGMYPALAGNGMVSAPGYTAHVILYGLRGMPSFEQEYTDGQIAAVSNYLSRSFGNKPDGEITGAEVKAERPKMPVVYIEY